MDAPEAVLDALKIVQDTLGSVLDAPSVPDARERPRSSREGAGHSQESSGRSREHPGFQERAGHSHERAGCSKAPYQGRGVARIKVRSESVGPSRKQKRRENFVRFDFFCCEFPGSEESSEWHGMAVRRGSVGRTLASKK